MKIRFSYKVIKKFAAAVMSLAMAVSMVGINAYAEEEAPVLYLEVSSTLTAQDSFAWTAYDHYNYQDYYLPTLPQHITYEGNNIKMIGYSRDAFKDFLFVEDNNDSRKILSFDLQRDSSSWHTVESGGFGLLNVKKFRRSNYLGTCNSRFKEILVTCYKKISICIFRCPQYWSVINVPYKIFIVSRIHWSMNNRQSS